MSNHQDEATHFELTELDTDESVAEPIQKGSSVYVPLPDPLPSNPVLHWGITSAAKQFAMNVTQVDILPDDTLRLVYDLAATPKNPLMREARDALLRHEAAKTLLILN